VTVVLTVEVALLVKVVVTDIGATSVVGTVFNVAVQLATGTSGQSCTPLLHARE
jgi:hypothetical protein